MLIAHKGRTQNRMWGTAGQGPPAVSWSRTHGEPGNVPEQCILTKTLSLSLCLFLSIILLVDVQGKHAYPWLKHSLHCALLFSRHPPGSEHLRASTVLIQ